MRKNLLKSFVLLAMMFVCNVAMAGETTTVYDFEDGESPFVIFDKNRISVSVVDDETLGSKVLKFTSGNMNAVAFAYLNFADKVEGASLVTVEYDFNITNVAGHALISVADADKHTGEAGGFTGKSNTGYGTNGVIHNLGCWRGGGANKFAVNGKQNDMAGLNAWCHAKVVVDVINKIVSYTITDASGEELISADGIAFFNASAANCSQIDVYIGTNQAGNSVSIDNLSITSFVDESATFYDYTINYYDETSNTIIKSEVRNGQEGAAITLTADDIKSFVNDDNTIKYVYTSDDSESKTITSAGTVVTIYFKQAAALDYSVVAQDSYGNILQTLKEGTVFEGDEENVTLSKYILVNGTWYVKDAPYAVSISERGQEAVVYEETDVAFFYECESMTTSKSPATSTSGVNYSNNSAIGHAANTYWYGPVIEEGGVFKVTVEGYSRRSGTTTIGISYRNNEGELTATGAELTWTNAGSEHITMVAEDVIIPEGCSLVLLEKTGYNSVSYLDYVVLEKSSDVAKADYTVAFVGPNGEELKPSETREGAVGIDVTLTSDDKLTIVAEDGTKYIYESDDAEGTTIAADGSTVVTVTFREAETYQYTVTSSVGDYQVEGEAIEGETVKVAYPRYVNVDGTLYEKAATNKEYNYSFVVNEDGQEETLDYNPTEISNVIYFAEGEDVEGMTVTSESNIAIRSSNSKAGYPKDKKVVFVWLEPGTYKLFSVVADCAGKTASAVFNYKTDDIEILTHTTENINWDQQEAEFTLDKASRVFVEQGGSSKKAIDFIYIQKLSAEGGVTTGVDGIAEMAEQPVATYTLSGVATRGGNLPKGIYIVGGKKKVVK